MKNLFTFCACALLACTVSAQTMSLVKGDIAGGFTYNSEYANDAIMDDLAITLGYCVADNIAIFATRDANNSRGDQDATWDLGLRYFYKGFYAQLNLNDVLGDDIEAVEAVEADPANGVEAVEGVEGYDGEAASLNIGAMINLPLGSFEGMYLDPHISLKMDDDNDATDEMNFGVSLGYKF